MWRVAALALGLVCPLLVATFAGPAAAQCPPGTPEPFDQTVVVKINGVQIDGDELVGGQPRLRKTGSGRRIFVIEGTFGIYTIDRCAGCSGPARLVIKDNVPLAACGSDGVNELALTDARIRVRPDATRAQLAGGLSIEFDGGFEAMLGGAYPHGVVMDGFFACRGSGRCVVPEGSRITVSAFGGEFAEELVKAAGRTGEPSLGFTVSAGRSFAKQVIEDVGCDSGGECSPNGKLKVSVTFGAAGDAVSLPGSIAVLFPNTPDLDGLALLLPAMMTHLTSSIPSGNACGGAVPCACGDTVVASRALDAAVDPVLQMACPGDGLIIGASDVELTIGLANTIRGLGNGTGILIAPGVTGATVRSGRIAGFAIGVRGTGNDDGTFTGLLVRGIVDSGLDVTGSGNRIETVVVERSGGGIAVDGDGNTVTGNRAVGNGGGIVVTGEGNTVTRNVVKLSGAGGMAIDGAGALVERNQIASSTGTGLTLEGTGHTVSRNAVKVSGGDGIAIPGGGDMALSKNTTDRSGGSGIRDATAGGGTAGTANTYVRNVCEAAALGDSSPPGLCL
jgi:parallel beta-helix repeat protein